MAEVKKMDQKDAVVIGGGAAQPSGQRIEVTAQKDISDVLKLEQYNLSHKHRGKAIIINQRNFMLESGQNDRIGTDLDAERLENLFCKMGFDVTKMDNLTVMQMTMELSKVARDEDYNNDASCFVCVMLSHGKDGNIFGIDRKTGIDSFTSKFTGDNCPSLAGKPKLFFIQACRGIKLDPGVEVNIDQVDSDKDTTDSVESPLCHIPIHADFLMSYAVVPGPFISHDPC